MALKLKTPASNPPVTLAQVKQHCRIEDDSQDGILQIYLDAAVGHVDGNSGVLGRAVMPQTWELYYDEFPSGPIEIPLGPLIAVDKVEYIDPVSGAYVELTNTNYVTDIVSYQGWISPVTDWPTPKVTINAVRITFQAGHADTDPRLKAIRAAVLLLVGHWYENRETVSAETLQNVPMAFDALIAAARKITV